MLFLFNSGTVIDTACSSSLVAMCSAVQDMRMGICDSAIVATSNLCLAPYSSYVFSSLGLLAHDGKCKVFDKSADGFVRSETVSCIFLQRRSLAKRVYATVMHAKTNTDGFKVSLRLLASLYHPPILLSRPLDFLHPSGCDSAI